MVENKIKLVSFNTQHKLHSHLNEFKVFIFKHKIDIICVQDTGITSKMSNMCMIPGYELIQTTNDKPKQANAIAMYIKKNLSHEKIEYEVDKEHRMIVANIKIMNKQIKIINAYMSPKKDAFRKIQAERLKELTNSKDYYIVAGDFNEYVDVNMDRQSSIPKITKPTNSKAFKYLEEANLIDSHRIINPDTKNFTFEKLDSINNRWTKTRIDYIWMSQSLTHLLCDANIIKQDYYISDHKPIFILFKADISETDKFVLFSKPNFKLTDKILMNHDIMNATTYNELTEAITKHNHTTATKQSNPPYVADNALRALKNDYRIVKKYLKKIIKSKLISDDDTITLNLIAKAYDQLVDNTNGNDVKRLGRLIKNKISYRLREMRLMNSERLADRLEETLKENPNEVFKMIKAKRNTTQIAAVKSNDVTYIEKEDVLKYTKIEWEKSFKDNSTPETALKETSNVSSFITKPITLEELKKVITRTKINKAAGPDEVYYESLKALDEPSLEKLLEHLNKALKDGNIPNDWKHCRLFPIYKNMGSKLEMQNYRPIALISNIYKIFTNLLNKRVNDYMNIHRMMPSEQAGFQKGKDTHTNIITVSNIIRHCNLTKSEFHAAFIDLSKAYDSVPYWYIDKTLNELNFPKPFIDLINNMYKQNTADVITAYGPTESFNIFKGLRQGDPLSPTLFNIMLINTINRIKNSKKGIKVNDKYFNILAYADDIIIFGKTNKDLLDTWKILLDEIKKIKIEINVGKSAYMWNNVNYIPKIPSILNKPIEALGNTGSYKYLGIYLNAKLDHAPHWISTINKFKTATIKILTAYIPFCTKIKLINQCAFPILTYSMNTLMMEDPVINELEKWLTKYMNITQKNYTNISYKAYTAIYELYDIKALNLSYYVNYNYNKILNNNSLANESANKKRLLAGLNNIIKPLAIVIKDSSNKKIDPINFKLNYANQEYKLKEETIVWTDGSFKDNKITSATWWGKDNPKNKIINTIGKSSFEAELYAIELAINQTKAKSLRIITDSKASIDALTNWNMKSKNVKNKSKYKSLINRIWLKITQNRVNVKFSHVFGHLDENRNSNDEIWMQKWEKTTKEWESATETVVMGNTLADIATNQIGEEIPIPEAPLGSDEYVILYKNKPWEGNILKLIRLEVTKININNWKRSTSGKTVKLINEKNVDWESTIWPIHEKSYKLFSLARLKHKILFGLPTRHALAKKNAKKPYDTEICPRCNKESENTEHIFTCETNKEIIDRASLKFTDEIKLIIKVNEEEPLLWIGNERSEKHAFTNRAVIYQSTMLNWTSRANSIEDEKKIVDTIRLTSNLLAQEIWKERCKALYKKTTTIPTQSPIPPTTNPTLI